MRATRYKQQSRGGHNRTDQPLSLISRAGSLPLCFCPNGGITQWLIVDAYHRGMAGARWAVERGRPFCVLTCAAALSMYKEFSMVKTCTQS